MARIKNTAQPVNVFSKYTIKQLHELVKSYNISNFSKLTKQQLIELLNDRFILNGTTLVLKSQNQFPTEFQTNNNYDLEFNNDLFSDFNESQNPLLQSMGLPVARKRLPPATKGNRKIIPPATGNRKIMPTGRPRGRPRKVPI